MRIFYLFGFLMLLNSCSYENVAPQFKKVSSINVKEFTFNQVTLESDLIYTNPNRIGGVIKSFDVDVLVNGINVGKLNQKDKTEILAKQDFLVPATVSFPPREILKNKGLLQSALQVLGNEKADVSYMGTMTVTVATIDFEVPVNYKESVDIQIGG